MRGRRPKPLDEGSGVFRPAGQGPLLYGRNPKAQDALLFASIYILAVTDLDDMDCKDPVLNRVENTEAALPDSISVEP